MKLHFLRIVKNSPDNDWENSVKIGPPNHFSFVYGRMTHLGAKADFAYACTIIGMRSPENPSLKTTPNAIYTEEIFKSSRRNVIGAMMNKIILYA